MDLVRKRGKVWDAARGTLVFLAAGTIDVVGTVRCGKEDLRTRVR